MVRKSKNQLKWEKRARQRNQPQQQQQMENQQQQYGIAQNVMQQKQQEEIIQDISQKQNNQSLQNAMINQEQQMNNETIHLDQPKVCQQGEMLNENENNKKLKDLIQCLGSQQVYLREKEKKEIQNFLHSVTQKILYVCGVTGTGKTTTIRTAIERLQIKYKIINCIMNVDAQKYLCQQDKLNSSEQFSLLVIDQCDQLKDINLVLTCLKLALPQIKIILICNQSCQYKIKPNFPLSIIYFMPYNKDCISQILSMKLGSHKAIVPNLTLRQAETLACKKGGDFRQAEKHITNWAKSYMTKNDQQDEGNDKIIHMHHNFADVFPNLLFQFLKHNTDRQNRLLSIVCEKCEQMKEKKQKRGKLQLCICQKKNNAQNIINEMKFEMTKSQGLLILKTWQEMGIIEIRKNACKFHQKQVYNIKLKVNNCLLKKMLSQSFYYKSILAS